MLEVTTSRRGPSPRRTYWHDHDGAVRMGVAKGVEFLNRTAQINEHSAFRVGIKMVFSGLRILAVSP